MVKKIFSMLMVATTVMLMHNAAMGQCPFPTGLNATSTNQGVMLTWNAIPGVTGYKVNIQNAPGNNVPMDVNFNVNTNSFLALNLSPGANYKFKVRSFCNNNTSNWSPNFFFTAFGNTCNPLQVTGVAATSANGATTITWNAVPGVSSYRVRIEDGQNNPIPFVLVRNPTTNSLVVTTLAPLTNYKVKVRANCNGNLGAWSVWLAFTTGPLRIAANTSIPTLNVMTFPNPANEKLTFEMNGTTDVQTINVTLLSITGVKVNSYSLNLASDDLSVDVHSIPSGIYFLQINDGVNTTTQRINIVH